MSVRCRSVGVPSILLITLSGIVLTLKPVGLTSIENFKETVLYRYGSFGTSHYHT